MIIRCEEESDYEEIYSLVKKAFLGVEQSDGNEQELVNSLRKGDGYIPKLALVMEIDKKIVGHIMFTKAKVGNIDVLALAPLSVLPEYQRRGVGKALIKEGHRIASKMGYSYSVVLGSEKYYPKMGYVSAEKYGIYPPFDVLSENFMAYKLNDGISFLGGIMKYSKEFGID